MDQLRRNDLQPLYQQVEELLRRGIATGTYAVGAPIPDERSLADTLGLSRMTVRRAIVQLTRQGVFHRVRGRGTFVAPSAAQAIATSRGDALPLGRHLREVVVVCDLDTERLREAAFYHRIVQAIVRSLPGGVPLAMRTPASFESARPRAGSRRSVGVVVLGIVDPQVLDAVARCGHPTVLVDSAQPSGATLDSVHHEDDGSSYAATAALVELGHRDIGIVNFAGTPAAEARRRGFLRALAAHRLALEPRWDLGVACSAHAAFARVREVLASGPAPSALFCAMDAFALGAIAAAKDAGLDVPGRLSVVGYGDFGDFCVPALSSVRIPLEQLGTAAIRLLADRCDDQSLPPRHVVLPTELMLRGTTAVPRPATD
ncbi:MAG TPA: GntR family transcriptional regulator [Planctomycetota bacterium]|nr:GntR family transcriptional regulator [Planctomycetota bacterium]